MGAFREVIGNIADTSYKAIPEKENDYKDPETGLLMCGSCHTAKEMIIRPFGRDIKVRCMCECMSADYNARMKAEEEHQRKLRFKEMREEAFPDESLAACTFKADANPASELSKVAKNFVKHFEELAKEGRGLVFFGKPGTGKTFYACCIANALLDKEFSVMVTSFSRLANTLMGMKGNIQDYIDRLNNFDLLVIDDYSVERNTEYMLETVFNVVDFRIKSGRPMIVTTNLARDQMRSQAQTNMDRARIISRLLEVCTFFEAKGEDMRLKAMKAEDAKYRNMLLEDDEDA